MVCRRYDYKKGKLGLKGQEKVDVVNLKRDVFNLSLIDNKGVFPAYHMNKEHWITALLDGEVKKEDLKLLIELSYSLTI